MLRNSYLITHLNAHLKSRFYDVRRLKSQYNYRILEVTILLTFIIGEIELMDLPCSIHTAVKDCLCVYSAT